MKSIVLDIETNGLENPTKIWCVVTECLETNEVKTFTEAEPLRRYLEDATRVIGHNIINFDALHLLRLYGLEIPHEKIVDTLILSRLLYYKVPGGHSLDAWGKRLRFPKQEFEDFSSFSEKMLEYCKNDVKLNRKLYEFLLLKLKEDVFSNAINLEHEFAFICRDMHENGFKFDYKKASEMREELEEKIKESDIYLNKLFPPKSYLVREVNPTLTKKGVLNRRQFTWYDGDDLSMFQENCPFSVIGWEFFNPGSPKQVVERLNELGWKPTEKTQGHKNFLKLTKKERTEEKEIMFKTYGWMINERNLSTLPEESGELGEKLLERVVLNSRYSTLKEWFHAYRHETGCVHGRFNGIGAWTHRMSHQKPNMANVAAEKSLKYNQERISNLVKNYGKRMRELWVCEDDEWLVGVDLEGIQLRVFGHYINDEKFTEALISGDKAKETDPHSLNKKALGPVCRTRDNAKTFIFAWLLGAAIPKISEILNCSRDEAEKANSNFLNFYPGLKYLKSSQVPKDADRGYFQGIDGRLVVCDSEHHMLAGYLQNGESVVVKLAVCLAYRTIKKLGLNARIRNIVHDEMLFSVKGTYSDAEIVKNICCRSIEKAGKLLNLNVPLQGEGKIGKNWYEVH